MVFSSLTQRDKEAFFALLDEYFESRPGLLHGSTNDTLQMLSASHTGSSSVKAAVNTPPRPPARSLSASTNSSSAAGKSRVVPPAPPSHTMTPRIVEPVERYGENEDVDEAPVSVSSRIAAAQAGIGMGNSNFSTAGRPPVPGSRRTSAQSVNSHVSPPSSTPSTPAAAPAPAPPSRTSRVPAGLNTPAPPPSSTPGANGLVSSRGIGSIDTSSGGAAVGSVFSFKGVGKNAPPKSPAILGSTAAFERPKTRDTFAPPPRRDTSAGTSPAPAAKRALAPEPESAQEEEEEAQGEWVEALYDLASEEPTDLSFKTGDQIWVTERTSKDWWMAESDGKAGLVPASYVKPL